MNNKQILIVHPFLKFTRNKNNYFLSEAENLVQAINLECVESSLIGLEKVSPNTFINKGNLIIFKKKLQNAGVDIVFFNVNLSPIQQRNLENELNAKVIDRTGLILEIFGSRAKSNEGKLSVELASLQFQKSRLVRSWTHLERQRGGAGFMGGPGEKQIESDKRQLTEKINRLKKKIKKIVSIRDLQRYRRIKNKIPVISLVGYTNSGKSTLFNKLTKSDVLSKNMLFASLDSTIRKSFFNNTNFLFVDTVGFISDLPTTLVDAFKSTLDEIIYSDLILHIRDISNSNYLEQKKDVLKILREIGIDMNDARILDVINKVDLIKGDRILHNSFDKNSIYISALNGNGIENLKKKIYEKIIY
ncbi:MAG: GTPase HflX [Rickettsiales bacterium]|nr:GTPase HflX [Rickettsiales bacterium]